MLVTLLAVILILMILGGSGGYLGLYGDPWHGFGPGGLISAIILILLVAMILRLV